MATDVLSAAVVWWHSHHLANPRGNGSIEYRCGWCSSGNHKRCTGVTTTPSGELACACAYTWRHA